MVEDGVGGGEWDWWRKAKEHIVQEAKAARRASYLTDKVQVQHLLVVSTLLIEMSISECFDCTRVMVSCDQVTHTGQCVYFRV